MHLQGVLRHRAPAGHTAGTVGTLLVAVAAEYIMATGMQAVLCAQLCMNLSACYSQPPCTAANTKVGRHRRVRVAGVKPHWAACTANAAGML